MDFWRVEDVRRPERVLLRAEMKLPGRAWLEWTVAPAPGGRSVVTQTALFEPRGLAGLAYWWALYPAHAVIFGGTLRAIARRAGRSAPGAPARAARAGSA